MGSFEKSGPYRRSERSNDDNVSVWICKTGFMGPDWYAHHCLKDAFDSPDFDDCYLVGSASSSWDVESGNLFQMRVEQLRFWGWKPVAPNIIGSDYEESLWQIVRLLIAERQRGIHCSSLRLTISNSVYMYPGRPTRIFPVVLFTPWATRQFAEFVMMLPEEERAHWRQLQ